MMKICGNLERSVKNAKCREHRAFIPHCLMVDTLLWETSMILSDNPELTFRIVKTGYAIIDIVARMILNLAFYDFQGLSFIIVISVDKIQIIALCQADSFVHGVVDAIVFLREPVHAPLEARLILAKDVNCPVGGPPVYHQILILLTGLRQNRIECLSYRFGAVKADCDDGEKHVEVTCLRN